jgi:magnesium transporter
MDIRKAAAILSHMDADAAVEVLREIEKNKRSLLIDLMDAEVRKDIALIASFDEDEIGSKMTTNYIVIRENLSVKQAMSSLIDQASKNDNISTIFVEDEDESFYGAIDLKELIIARQGADLKDLIMTSYPYVYGIETIDDCIEKLKDYSENSIPVLDNNNHLLGVITSQNIIQVVDDEMGEDYAKFAGLTAEEDLTETLPESMKKRMPWLLILLALGMVVSSVVGIFEAVVSQLTLIMSFQSLILDMAGNVGTQSLAVTIRVLMDESLTGKQKLGLVWKEMRIGMCNGLILGTVSFVLIGLYIYLLKGKGLGFAYAVSGCVGIALLVAMVISSAVGTSIPLFFKKIHVDPAVASGPLITTVNDLVAVVTYYGLSWILLINVLHLAG